MRFLSNKSTLFVTGSVTLLLAYLLYEAFSPLGKQGGWEIIKLQFAFTPERFEQIVSGWGPLGISIFIRDIYLDYIFPIFYALFLSGIVARMILRKSGGIILPRQRLFLYLPFLAAVFDFIENLLHERILSNIESIDAMPVFAASVCATVKWIMILASILIAIRYSMRSRP